MKLLPSSHPRPCTGATARPGPRRHQRGMAVVVVLALLTLILIYVMGNLHALSSLDRELKLTERRQLKRLDTLSATNAATLRIRAAATNAPPAL